MIFEFLVCQYRVKLVICHDKYHAKKITKSLNKLDITEETKHVSEIMKNRQKILVQYIRQALVPKQVH